MFYRMGPFVGQKHGFPILMFLFSNIHGGHYSLLAIFVTVLMFIIKCMFILYRVIML